MYEDWYTYVLKCTINRTNCTKYSPQLMARYWNFTWVNLHLLLPAATAWPITSSAVDTACTIDGRGEASFSSGHLSPSTTVADSPLGTDTLSTTIILFWIHHNAHDGCFALCPIGTNNYITQRFTTCVVSCRCVSLTTFNC